MSEQDATDSLPETPATRKRGRPRRTTASPATNGPSFTDEQFQQLIAALGSSKSGSPGIDMDALKTVLESTAAASAFAMKKSLKPENQDHPGISALSYPEGDQQRPRPVLPFELFLNGYPIHKFPETQHWRELELACDLQPGEFLVMRKDGTSMTVAVKGERDAAGALSKVMVEFPISREEKALVPPQIVLFYQLVHPDRPRQRFMEAMAEYYRMTMGSEAEPVPVLVRA